MSDTTGSWHWNFDEADELVDYGERIDPGTYQVVISKVDIVKTKAGEEMPKLQMTIENHPKNSGRFIFDQWYLPNPGRQERTAFKKTLAFMKMRLQAIYRRPFNGDNGLDAQDLWGRRVLVRVGDSAPQAKKDEFDNDIYIDGKQQFFPTKTEVQWYFPYEPTGAQVAQQVPLGVPMQMPTGPVSVTPPANGGAPVAAPAPSPAPSPQPTPTASAPTPSAPAAAPSAPEAPGEDDPANTFRL